MKNQLQKLQKEYIKGLKGMQHTKQISSWGDLMIKPKHMETCLDSIKVNKYN